MCHELSELIGKEVDLLKAAENDFDYDRLNYPQPVLEKFLSGFEVETVTDRHGFISYSIKISLENRRIKRIERIAYSPNICCERRLEFKMERFTSPPLEKEAYENIAKILNEH